MLDLDDVIAKSLPNLSQSPKLSKVVKKGLDFLLHESAFNDFSQTYPHLQGVEFVEQVLEEFDFSCTVCPNQLENIPESGPVVIAANHPIGSLDALALVQLLHKVRPDIQVVANRMLMALKPMHPLLLPVNNVSGHSLKRELANIHQHLKQGGALLIFPAGEVSRLRPHGVRDGQWKTGFIKMAKKAQAPILPIHIKAKNSALFYGTSMLYKPLASMLLVKEMFKQKQKSMAVTLGKAIAPELYLAAKHSDTELAKIIRKHVYQLPRKSTQAIPTLAPIAAPENRTELQQAIAACECIGHTADNMAIVLYRYQGSSVLFRELGRLREVAFRAVGEGTHKRRDIDKFDMDYDHLVLWDKDALEVVGAYRLAGSEALLSKNPAALYTKTLFQYHLGMAPYFAKGIELGRSFVQPKYWGRKSLDYLWYGIGAYLQRYSEYRYLFGAVSLSNALPLRAKELIVFYYQHYYGVKDTLASANNPVVLSEEGINVANTLFCLKDAKADFSELKFALSQMHASVPTLFKQYAELCEPGGVRFLSFSTDPAFNDCIDALVLVDLTKLKAQKAKRYLNHS